jgi:hypothetical protein
MPDYDLWRCDECRLVLPAATPQQTVRVQQTSERNYATNEMVRPVETITLCPVCHARLAHGVDASKRLPCIDVCADEGHPHGGR